MDKENPSPDPIQMFYKRNRIIKTIRKILFMPTRNEVDIEIISTRTEV
jgi:hypothetical protein